MYPVKFIPVPMERIWGGHELKSWFAIDNPNSVGEYWVVSGHPNGESVVHEGPLAGMTLSELTSKFPQSYLGQSPQARFPLLVKFLEAQTDLSVQIHPDDTYAKAHEDDFGKTEAWYVLDAQTDGQVNLGHTFPNRDVFEDAVATHRVRDYLSYRSVRKGDLVFVPARTLHALLAGTKVLEIQQTSDVTYRVYDWDRVGASGRMRELHVDKAADVLEYGVKPPVVEPTTLVHTNNMKMTRLVSCEYFTIDSCSIRSHSVMHIGREGNPDVVIVLGGEGALTCTVEAGTYTLPLKHGDAVLVPSDIAEYRIQSDTSRNIELIRTFYG